MGNFDCAEMRIKWNKVPILSRNGALERSGFTVSLPVDRDYGITPTLKLFGRVAYDKAASWNET